jgi:hypothetical protein
MKRWTAVCDWRSNYVCDSDEIQVRAKTAAGAASRARKIWKARHCSGCRLEKIWILTPRRLREFA